jgi:integrase
MRSCLVWGGCSRAHVGGANRARRDSEVRRLSAKSHDCQSSARTPGTARRNFPKQRTSGSRRYGACSHGSWKMKSRTSHPIRDAMSPTSEIPPRAITHGRSLRSNSTKAYIPSAAKLALALLLYTGTRRSDLVRLGRQHVRAGWITFTAQKNINRKPVTIEVPMLPVLQSIIDASPTGDLTYLVTDHGQPFTPAGFGGWFREQCDKAGLKHCSAHGLRKAGASIAAENGASPHQLMAIFGWLTLKETEPYTQAARRRRMARAGMGFLIRKETYDDEQIFPTSHPGDFPTD